MGHVDLHQWFKFYKSVLVQARIQRLKIVEDRHLR
jgi:hypothetical protein